MAQIRSVSELELDSPFLVEGLPGVGLVGQIIADHLDETLGMSYHAAVDCDSLPQVAVFDEGMHDVQPPVRLLADEENDLVVLQSDVPVSPNAEGFVDCLMGWIQEENVTPLFISGLPTRPEGTPTMFGVSTGDGEELLGDIEAPEQAGVVSGSTGALLKEADDRGVDSVGLVVETDPQFPDPAASRVVLERGITPITGIEVGTDELVDKSEQIMDAKEQLAKQMQDTKEESTTATTTGMYQ
ncbi:MAG: proteasome assembly chaperone family protein [Halobacteria archaeon]